MVDQREEVIQAKVSWYQAKANLQVIAEERHDAVKAVAAAASMEEGSQKDQALKEAEDRAKEVQKKDNQAYAEAEKREHAVQESKDDIAAKMEAIANGMTLARTATSILKDTKQAKTWNKMKKQSRQQREVIRTTLLPYPSRQSAPSREARPIP